MSEGDKAVRLSIRGRVQGVAYRAWAVGQAAALGLRGWVRNRDDGSVEAVVAGDALAVDEFITAARRGPRAARVSQVDVAPAAPDVVGQGFRQLPTA
jgi:acylphosphatase